MRSVENMEFEIEKTCNLNSKCPRCGWEGLRKDCKGGDPADMGDYYCPKCYKQDIWVIVDD